MSLTEPDYWQKQTADRPLYPEMLWSRPENRTHAGKLLIMGGNAQGFAAAGEAYAAAAKAGIGTARMLLPDALRKILGADFSAGEYAPTTPSGSFSQKALAEALAMASWADGVMVAGDLGANSETAVLLEKFAAKYDGQLTLTGDAIDYFISTPLDLLNRSETLLVIGLGELQKFGVSARFTTAFTSDMDILRFVSALHELSASYPASIIVKHVGNLFVASGGRVISTKHGEGAWNISTAAAAAVWWLQNPAKTPQALATSLVDS